MFLKWLAVFFLVPLIEMIVLIWVGSALGVFPTTALILTTAVLGAWLTRREGLGVLRKLKQDLAMGLPPAHRIAEGALILAGGLLLLTPGIFTDIAGFLLTIPWTRSRIAPALLRALSDRVVPGESAASSQWRVAFDAKLSTPTEEPTKPPVDPFEHPVA